MPISPPGMPICFSAEIAATLDKRSDPGTSRVSPNAAIDQFAAGFFAICVFAASVSIAVR